MGDMSMEAGFEINDEKKEKSVESLFAELPSVGEAIQKFDDPGLKTVFWDIHTADCIRGKSEDEKKEIVKNFETEVWLVYKEVIRSLLTSEEFHKKVLEGSGYLTNTQLRELAHGLDFVRVEIFEEVLSRVDMLLRHSVDTDLMCLMFKDLLRGQINGSTQKLFSESEVETLSKIFNEDSKCQNDFVLAIMNTRGVVRGNGLGEDDTKFAKDFINRLTKLSSAEDATTIKKLEGLFFNRDTEELGQVFSSEFRNILVKDSLAMVSLFVPKSTEVNNSLTTGRKDYLLERARKLEIVKLLIKVEQLQNELLDFNLEDVNKYSVTTGTAESSTAATINKAIEYKVLDDLSDLSKADWFAARHEVMEMFGEW
ncbi:hypothetical protein A2572_00675 [Candidatus Collierbacteria bacterium RIFOXYD1_FULL_40_9]|uniref:Uncharacterized protein n=1 Tax=Candidatus Collierbacteria bacterium RIFOXYD1_FULL_40_9 TaxID=1817731 RepID=A0A1F5FWM3_9BACT|nr:MAG: hypothetical protein A2572_00675 [Candidatus Collierbacteria bacterium RIFOXYD1_FULL_40_9]